MARQKLGSILEMRLEKYYGEKRCVLTASLDAQYHHLDDKDDNTTFGNLIPLGSRFNSPILRDAKARSLKEPRLLINAELAPETLMNAAQKLFADWKVAQAYGCARLAYFVGKNYFNMNSEARLPLACNALYFARHSVEYALIADILYRDVLPIAQERQIGAHSRALIIQEIAGLLSEHGRFRESLSLFQLIPSAISRAMFASTGTKYAALLRRKATTIVAESGKGPDVETLLSDARAAAPYSENIKASIANTLAWECLSRSDYRGTVDILAPLVEEYDCIFTPGENIEPINITAWNAAEIFHSYGIAAYHLGERYSKRGKTALRKASLIFKRAQSRPFLLREDIWAKEYKSMPQNAASDLAVFPVMRLPPEVDGLIGQITRCLVRS